MSTNATLGFQQCMLYTCRIETVMFGGESQGTKYESQKDVL